MNRDKTAPAVLLLSSLIFLAWSIVVLLSPGGAASLEWFQLVAGLASTAFGGVAFVRNEPSFNRVCRYLLLGYAIAGVVIVYGLAADQRSSRTWARLGWSALLLGYIGSVVAWWQVRERRATTIVLGAVGLVLVLGGMGITANCDPTVQKTWCDPAFEREEALAEEITAHGELLQRGRSGVLGPAQVSYVITPGTSIQEAVELPGEWAFEGRPLQPDETERGRFVTNQNAFGDCELDAKVEEPPQGTVLTVYVRCGVSD